jgi:hypothetical protein
MSQWWILRRTNCLLHTQQHTTHNIKHKTLSPWSPQAAGFQRLQFKGECNRRMLRNRSQSLQHGIVTYINKTNCSVILFTIILQAAAWCACGQKLSFICYYSCFFCATASEQHALTSAIRQYFISPYTTSNSHVSA